MKIAVLSDIHDNVWKLDAALRAVASSDLLICCGDLCSPFIIDQLARAFPHPIHIVFGNNDADLFRITAKTRLYPHVQLHGEFFAQDFDDRRIAVHHFDNVALELARAARFDAVFYGHNHLYANELIGATLALNPGAIMGARFDAQAYRFDVPSTFAVYDTASGAAQGYRIRDGSLQVEQL